jgi:hypothetical protein
LGSLAEGGANPQDAEQGSHTESICGFHGLVILKDE